MVHHRAPASALWLGARIGGLAPFGRLFYDDSYTGYGPAWSDVASPGLSFEGNIGGRFARRFVVYGFWEHAVLGAGSSSLASVYPAWQVVADATTGAHYDRNAPGAPALDTTPRRASTDLAGVGLRWTSHPDDVGLVVDFGLGYRWASVDFHDGSTLSLASPLDVRFGIGADVRLSRTFSLSPMLVFENGVFTDLKVQRADGSAGSLSGYSAGEGTVGLQLGGHFDLAGSNR